MLAAKWKRLETIYMYIEFKTAIYSITKSRLSIRLAIEDEFTWKSGLHNRSVPGFLLPKKF